jgi:hypothetical protein
MTAFAAKRVRLTAADVRLRDTDLLWRQDLRTRSQACPDDLLLRFCTLAEKTEDQLPGAILTFARRFGPLAICKHGLPRTHHVPALGTGNPCQTVTTVDRGEVWNSDPLDAWHRLAVEALVTRVLIDFVATNRAEPIHFGILAYLIYPGTPPAETPLALDLALPAKASELAHRRVKFQQRAAKLLLLEWAVERWWKLGDVRLRFDYSQASPSATLAGEGLFGALAEQLISYASTRLGGFALPEGRCLCDSCYKPFVPRRHPAAGQNHYCEDCGRRAALRDAQRRLRAKQRAMQGTDRGAKLRPSASSKPAT